MKNKILLKKNKKIKCIINRFGFVIKGITYKDKQVSRC